MKTKKTWKVLHIPSGDYVRLKTLEESEFRIQFKTKKEAYLLLISAINDYNSRKAIYPDRDVDILTQGADMIYSEFEIVKVEVTNQ
jgi:uncharacterized protein with WD repeat